MVKKCLPMPMLGETAYTLKDIAANENINLNKLRSDATRGILRTSGKLSGAYYVIQSELDKYLMIITNND